MSLFLPCRRSTILVPQDQGNINSKNHLFVLVAGKDNKWLITSFSTLRQGVPHDPTCLLYPGDHGFIKQPSFVKYALSRIEDQDKLVRAVNSGLFTPREALAEVVFARVCAGIEASRFSSAEIKAFYAASAAISSKVQT